MQERRGSAATGAAAPDRTGGLRELSTRCEHARARPLPMAAPLAMAEPLAGRLRGAEATGRRQFTGPAAEWTERRRRLRLDVLRDHLHRAYGELRSRHDDGASGAESVRTRAAFMDDLLRELYRAAAAEVQAAGYP